MGLDIRLRTDVKMLYSSDLEEYQYLFERGDHHLSRTFCNFMCRKNVVYTPELNQIGKLLNLDISPLYKMEEFDEYLEFLEFIELEEERKQVIDKNNAAREKIEGNIDIIIKLVSQIINGLSKFDDLVDKLWDNDYDTLDNPIYFSEFKKEREKGYNNNNFGQDLRSFEQFLLFAKNQGAKTVWFSYG